MVASAGIPTGLLTTVELRIGGHRIPNGFHHTTPEAPEVQSLLARILQTHFVGRFNVYNWLAAVAVALGQGVDWGAIERAAEVAVPVRGRMQRVDEGQPFTVLVDFAHTPQALAAVLESCRDLARGRIIVVFGHPGGAGRRAGDQEHGVIWATSSPRRCLIRSQSCQGEKCG